MFTKTIGVTVTGHFHFRNNETEDLLVYQSNAVGVALFSYVNMFVHRNLGQRSENHFLLSFIQQKAALVSVKQRRVNNTQPNYSFHFVKTCLQGF